MEDLQYDGQGHNGPLMPPLEVDDNYYRNHQISSQINGIRENMENFMREISTLRQQIEQYNLINADLLTLRNVALTHGGDLEQLSAQKQAKRKMIVRYMEQQQHMQKGTVAKIQRLQNNLETRWLQILQHLEETLTVLISIERMWGLQQQLHANGPSAIDSSLDAIQHWCEDLYELMWHAIEQVHEMIRFWTYSSVPASVNLLNTLGTHEMRLQEMLTNLMKSAFVIELQPPQVIKINSRFSATVRLLVGSKLNIMNKGVQVKIVCENQIDDLLSQHSTFDGLSTCGDLVNHSTALNNNATSKALRGEFRSLQLRNCSRSARRSNDVVTETKLAMVFQCSVNVGNTVFDLTAVSLPIVVTVHANQEAPAWGTITWHNAFAPLPKPGAVFVVADKVRWSELRDTLNTKFYSACSMPLEPDHLRYLETKLFRGQPAAPNTMVTWSQFARNYLPGHTFSFWDWYYNAFKMTKLYLTDMWKNNMIIGFISKPDAEGLLAGRAQGTFLIRFSDSTCGAVTVVWIEANGQVFSLKPFTTTNLGASGLPNRLLDLEELVTLYPDISKDQLLKFATGDPVPVSSSGYITWKTKTEIVTSPSRAATPITNQQQMAGMHPQNSTQDMIAFPDKDKLEEYVNRLLISYNLDDCDCE